MEYKTVNSGLVILVKFIARLQLSASKTALSYICKPLAASDK